MNRVLLTSSRFVRAAKKVVKKQPRAAEDVHAALAALAQDAFGPQLRTHKLKGDLAAYWAASAGRELRIVFQLISVGTHEEIY